MTNFLKTGKFIESNRHILFITPGFPANEQDTQCIPALHIFAKALADSGVKVSIISLQYPFTKKPYTWHGISVYPLNAGNKKLKQLFLAGKAISTASKINKESKVDCVHSFWLHRATTIGVKIANAINAPIIATAMGQEMRAPNRSFQQWKQAKFPIISLCQFQADELKNQGVFPVAIIPWGLTETRSTEKDIDLICVGSLITLKNVEYFLELCVDIKEMYPNIQATIIGDGPMRGFVEGFVEVENLTDNVKILGELPYEETQETIARSKVLVHASEFEGFGMTIIEAMASETHVLSTPVGIAKSLEIPHLIGDAQLDVAMLQMLLKSNRPEAVEFSITDTVNAYRAIYESESKGKESDS